jgi:hypothetical protein
MNPVIERIAAADPVPQLEPGATNPIWDSIQAQLMPRPPRHTRSHGRVPRGVSVLAGIGSVVAVVVFVLLPGGAGSLAARAYSATDTANSVATYTMTLKTAGGSPSLDGQAHAWISGDRSLVRATTRVVANGHAVNIRTEFETRGRRFRLYQQAAAAPGTIFEGDTATTSSPSCVALTNCGGTPEDPIDAFRRLYRAGVLRNRGVATYRGERASVLSGGGSGAVEILVSEQTHLPIAVIETNAGHPTAITEIRGYRKMPLTAATAELLAMRPHPGVRVEPWTSLPVR